MRWSSVRCGVPPTAQEGGLGGLRAANTNMSPALHHGEKGFTVFLPLAAGLDSREFQCLVSFQTAIIRTVIIQDNN